MSNSKQPTVREINAHTWAGTGTCVVYAGFGFTMRISRARTRDGVKEGRVITCSGMTGSAWQEIPADATVELI